MAPFPGVSSRALPRLATCMSSWAEFLLLLLSLSSSISPTRAITCQVVFISQDSQPRRRLGPYSCRATLLQLCVIGEGIEVYNVYFFLTHFFCRTLLTSNH